MRTMLMTAVLSLCMLTTAPRTQAQVLPPEQQIIAAVHPAPESLRGGAKVLGYSEDGDLVTLREGVNELICLADDPSDSRFHVACYHASLEPFMARGRELRAEGKARNEVQATRLEEAESGKLTMPDHPAALYSLTGPEGSFDPATGTVEGASPLYVVYMPYATEETTGLSTSPAGPGAPWIMDPGKPWAHIMVIPKPGDSDDN